MFTGLIADIGIVREIQAAGSNRRLVIGSETITSDARIGDSIAINGVCLTITSIQGSRFVLDAVEETLRKTNLGLLRVGSHVNLEPALQVGSRLGGHFVQGHVDATGTISGIKQREGSWLFEIRYPRAFSKYMIPVGSVSINGVSLTIAEKRDEHFIVSIIPHTFEHTCFRDYATGEKVNLEFDLLGKYVVGLIEEGKKGGGIQLDAALLESLGY
jgi:riboflavin synthase